DRSVRAPELLQNAAPCGVRESGERGVEMGGRMLNHMVQFLPHRFAAGKLMERARGAPPRGLDLAGDRLRDWREHQDAPGLPGPGARPARPKDSSRRSRSPPRLAPDRERPARRRRMATG